LINDLLLDPDKMSTTVTAFKRKEKGRIAFVEKEKFDHLLKKLRKLKKSPCEVKGCCIAKPCNRCKVIHGI